MIAKLRELYAYRELLLNLVKKELKLRYRGSVLGFLWSLLNPLLMMLVFTFVFANVFKLGIKDFPVFLLVGLLPWNFFSGAVSSSTGSIINYGHLVKKVYFPREILPISYVLADLVNFLLAMLVLIPFLIYYGYNFYIYIPLVLVVIVLQVCLTLGFAFILSSLNVFFRDIQYIVGVIMLILFYATPIIYSLEMIQNMSFMKEHPWLLTVYQLNPLTALITMYRNMLYNMALPSLKIIGFSIGVSLAVLFLGYFIFHKMEPRFAEEV
ncbi:MAG: ABC transporter permease [Actinomycetota bacterium]